MNQGIQKSEKFQKGCDEIQCLIKLGPTESALLIKCACRNCIYFNRHTCSKEQSDKRIPEGVLPIGSLPRHSSFIMCILDRRCLAKCP